MTRQHFVNRHGRALDVDDGVEQVSVQEQRTDTASAVASAGLKPRFHTRMAKPRISKKVLLVAVGIVLIAALALLMAIDATKRGYERQTAAMVSSVSSIKDKTSSTETSAKDATKGLLSQLNAPTECSGNNIVTSYYTPAREAHARCLEIAQVYGGMKTSVKDMDSVVGYLSAQKDVLSPALSPPENGAFAEIPAEVDAWRQARDKLRQLSAPTQVVGAHTNLVKKVEQVSLAWEELLIAYNAQDAVAFADSETKLTKAYEALRVSADEFDEIVSRLQSDIQKAVSFLDNA